MRISILLLTVLLIVAVAAVGAKDIFRQVNATGGARSEQNDALDDALKNGMLSQSDYEAGKKKIVLGKNVKNSGKIDSSKNERSNPPQP